MTTITNMDPKWDGIGWFKSALGPKGSYDFTGTAVDKIFDRYVPAVSFDFKWLGWLMENLVVKLIDQMPETYPNYKREHRRLTKVVNVFKRESAKAARDYALSQTNMKDRVMAANVLMKVFNTAYKGI